MNKKISMETVRELYRVDNKYWRTGDTDILEKRASLAAKIDGLFWDCICDIMRMVTQKHFPVQKFVDVIKLLGYEVEEDCYELREEPPKEEEDGN